MLLAAGRGERLRPLTDRIPKPLIVIGGKPLISHHLLALASAGYRRVVINISHLREQIPAALGDGSAFGVEIVYSDEGDERLETGGGIFKALPLLGAQPFLVMNSDIWCGHALAMPGLGEHDLVHAVLVSNPPDHKGDFSLRDGRLGNQTPFSHTFAGIAWYRPEFFAGCSPGRFPLAPLLRKAADDDRASAEDFTGRWMDLGTFERLERLRNLLHTTKSPAV